MENESETPTVVTEENAEPEKKIEKYPCDICKLTFSNSSILDSHLAGKRHQKNLRSQNLGGLIKETTNSDGVTSGKTVIGQFYCKDCGIYANSSSQLDVHMQSSKHKLKVEQKDTDGDTQNSAPKALKKKAKQEGGADGSPTKKAKSEGPAEVFRCELCNVETNSKTQYEQHMASNRHKNRGNPDFNGQNNGGLSSRKRKGAAFMARKRQSRFGLGYDQPLSSSFVSGGSNDSQQSNMSLLYGRAKQYSAAMMYQQQQSNFKKSNDYSYATDMANSANGGNKLDAEAYRNAYNRSAGVGLNQGNYNNMAKKAYYNSGGDDGYSNYGQMGNQGMGAAQYNLSAMSYNNNPMKGSFSLW